MSEQFDLVIERGIDTGIIDVVLVGDIDEVQLDDFALKTEAYIQRKIRSLVLSKEEFDRLAGKKSLDPVVKLWDRKDGIDLKAEKPAMPGNPRSWMNGKDSENTLKGRSK